MSQTPESLEWRSVKDALRTLYADTVRSTLSAQAAVVAYTDGACIKNPGGPAGWSVILIPTADLNMRLTDESIAGDAIYVECYGHIPRATTTTNNRAEITAVLAALSLAPPELPLKIYSDSEYTIKVASGIYKINANPDLWELYRFLRNHRKTPPTFEWVRGHAGHALNEHADKLAGLGAWNGDQGAYDKWQASTAPEAHNAPIPAEQSALREQVQRLQSFFDGAANDARIGANERTFINDMAKRLRKNAFVPSEKQRNWIKGLATKYRN